MADETKEDLRTARSVENYTDDEALKWTPEECAIISARSDLHVAEQNAERANEALTKARSDIDLLVRQYEAQKRAASIVMDDAALMSLAKAVRDFDPDAPDIPTE